MIGTNSRQFNPQYFGRDTREEREKAASGCPHIVHGRLTAAPSPIPASIPFDSSPHRHAGLQNPPLARRQTDPYAEYSGTFQPSATGEP